NSGTFNANAGTVTLTGSNQTITGTNTFYNLTKSVTSPATLTFPSSVTTTILGALNLNGTAGNLLTLAPSAAATQWFLSVPVNTSATYLSVSYSTNPGGAIFCTTGCVDGGNNYGWAFAIPAAFTWIGEGANNNWSTGANWQGGVAPSNANTAIFTN